MRQLGYEAIGLSGYWAIRNSGSDSTTELQEVRQEGHRNETIPGCPLLIRKIRLTNNFQNP